MGRNLVVCYDFTSAKIVMNEFADMLRANNELRMVSNNRLMVITNDGDEYQFTSSNGIKKLAKGLNDQVFYQGTFRMMMDMYKLKEGE